MGLVTALTPEASSYCQIGISRSGNLVFTDSGGGGAIIAAYVVFLSNLDQSFHLHILEQHHSCELFSYLGFI